MSNPIPIICFGANEESYYIGVRTSFVAPNMPEALVETANKIAPMRIKYVMYACFSCTLSNISIDGEQKDWVIRDEWSQTCTLF